MKHFKSLAILLVGLLTLAACASAPKESKGSDDYLGLLPGKEIKADTASLMMTRGLSVVSVNGQAVKIPAGLRIRLAPGSYKIGFNYYLGTVSDNLSATGDLDLTLGAAEDIAITSATGAAGTPDQLVLRLFQAPVIHKAHASRNITVNMSFRGNDPNALVFVPGSATVAIPSGKGSLELIEAPATKSIEKIKLCEAEFRLLVPGRKDGQLLASDSLSAVWTIDVPGRQARKLFQAAAPIKAMGTGQDSVVVTLDTGGVEIHDAQSGALRASAPGLAGAELSLIGANGSILQCQGKAAQWRSSPEADLRHIATASPIVAAAIHPDGQTLAIGLKDGTIRLYFPGREEPVSLFDRILGEARFKTVLQLGFTADGSQLEAMGSITRALFWDLADLSSDQPGLLYNGDFGAAFSLGLVTGRATRSELLADSTRRLVAYRMFDQGVSLVIVDKY